MSLWDFYGTLNSSQSLSTFRTEEVDVRLHYNPSKEVEGLVRVVCLDTLLIYLKIHFRIGVWTMNNSRVIFANNKDVSLTVVIKCLYRYLRFPLSWRVSVCLLVSSEDRVSTPKNVTDSSLSVLVERIPTARHLYHYHYYCYYESHQGLEVKYFDLCLRLNVTWETPSFTIVR